jgi:hypothetical protein
MKKVMYAGSQLKGSPLDWFTTLVAADSPLLPTDPALQSYNGFVEELTKLYGDPDTEGTALREIKKLRQEDVGGVAAYVTAFKRWSVHLGAGFGDAAIRGYFMEGLSKFIHRKVVEKLAEGDDKLKTTDDVIRYATYMDSYLGNNDSRKEIAATTRGNNATRAPRPSPFPPRSEAPIYIPLPSRPPVTSASTVGTPMELDSASHAPPRGEKVSPEERARRERLGLCYYCGNHKFGTYCHAEARKKMRASEVVIGSGEEGN